MTLLGGKGVSRKGGEEEDERGESKEQYCKPSEGRLRGAFRGIEMKRNIWNLFTYRGLESPKVAGQMWFTGGY